MHCHVVPQLGARELFGGDIVARPACEAGSRAAAYGRGHSSWRIRRGRRLGDRVGFRRGLGLRQDFLGEEQELSGVDPLALLAEAVAEELFELVLKLLVEMELLVQRGEQLADELMGRFQVVRELVHERGVHTPYYVDV